MGADIAERWPDLVDAYYRPADEILGIPLTDLCRHGPQEALRETAVTQPAIFVTSMAALDVLRRRGVRPDVVAGHSLGEYAALTAAGVLEWTDALRLVRYRGELMAAVNERVPGAMLAVMGLDLAVVEELCARVAEETGQVVEVANDNEPAQAVVSGEAAAVARLGHAATEAGARKVVPLGVGAPFHCALMRSVEADFADALAAVDFRDPVVPVVSSVTGEPIRDARDAVGCLRRQLAGRVEWTGAVRRMVRDGVSRCVEVGPGKVLAGLCRRISPELEIHTTGDAVRLDRACEALTAPSEDGATAKRTEECAA
ncbi:ACP S-malonyltransferase [Streptomyces macrosporus]